MWLGWRDELQCVGLCFVPHPGNSHREKALLYALLAAVVLLVLLRAVGLASFDDPIVHRFVEFGFEVMKLGTAFVFGSTHKGERLHRRASRGA